MDRAEKLAKEAIFYLNRANVNGAFANPAFRQVVLENASFDSLRSRKDFERFLATLPQAKP